MTSSSRGTVGPYTLSDDVLFSGRGRGSEKAGSDIYLPQVPLRTVVQLRDGFSVLALTDEYTTSAMVQGAPALETKRDWWAAERWKDANDRVRGVL